jgi:hypothetical protein
MNQDQVDYSGCVDTMNGFCHDAYIPRETRLELRTYFYNCRGLFKEQYFQQVLGLMSPGLRGEFTAHTTGPWIRSIYFFRTNGNENEALFVAQISQRLRRFGFPAGEQIIAHAEKAEQMFIIRQGLIGAHGRVMRRGCVIGEDIVLSSRRLYTAHCLTFCDLYVLDKSDLSEILEDPDFQRQRFQIRRASNWLLLRSRFLAVGRAVRAAKKQGHLGNDLISQDFGELWQQVSDFLGAQEALDPSRKLDMQEEAGLEAQRRESAREKREAAEAEAEAAEAEAEREFNEEIDGLRGRVHDLGNEALHKPEAQQMDEYAASSPLLSRVPTRSTIPPPGWAPAANRPPHVRRVREHLQRLLLRQDYMVSTACRDFFRHRQMLIVDDLDSMLMGVQAALTGKLTTPIERLALFGGMIIVVASAAAGMVIAHTL